MSQFNGELNIFVNPIKSNRYHNTKLNTMYNNTFKYYKVLSFAKIYIHQLVQQANFADRLQKTNKWIQVAPYSFPVWIAFQTIITTLQSLRKKLCSEIQHVFFDWQLFIYWDLYWPWPWLLRNYMKKIILTKYLVFSSWTWKYCMGGHSRVPMCAKGCHEIP